MVKVKELSTHEFVLDLVELQNHPCHHLLSNFSTDQHSSAVPDLQTVEVKAKRQKNHADSFELDQKDHTLSSFFSGTVRCNDAFLLAYFLVFV